MRTKARGRMLSGVVQDRTEAGVIRAGMGREEGGVGGGGARGWGGATSGKALWMLLKTGLLFCWKLWVGFEQKSDLL